MSIFILKSFNKGAIDLSKENIALFSNEIINKIKNEMEKMNIFIRKKKNMEEKNIEKSEKFILKLMTELENDKIIESKTIYKAKNISDNILSIKDMKISIQIDINKKPFEIIKFNGNEYQISETYNTIRDLKTMNIQTNKINTTNSNLAVISQMINRKIYIDTDLLSKIYKQFIKENNIEDNIEEYYKKMLVEYSKLINEGDKISIQKISKKISIYKKALFLDYLVKNEIKEFYSPVILDFRGRVYITSQLSLTFVKELRYCVYLGKYDKKFINSYKMSKTDELLEKHFNLLEKMKEWEKIKNLKKALKISIM
jgi:hypothetical protein